MVTSESGVNDIALCWDVRSVLVNCVFSILLGLLRTLGDSKHVAAQMELTFTNISDWLSEYFSHIFNDNGVFGVVSATE